MRVRVLATLLTGLAWAAALCAQPEPLIADKTQLDIKGVITAVRLEPGAGMPSLAVKAEDGREWKVWLGSMRYLVDNNFSPKAGQKVAVQAYRGARDGEAVAVSVTLVETQQSLKLRDGQGRPLWRGFGRRQRGPR